MYVDDELLLSDGQDIKANGSKVSSYSVDLSLAKRDIGKGEQLYVVVVVDTYIAGSNTTLTISLLNDEDEDLVTSPVTLISTRAIATGEISAGMVPIVIPIPSGMTKQYLGLDYACATVATALTVTAFIAKDVQTNIQ